MSDEPMQENRKYLIKHTSRNARCVIRKLVHRVDIDTLEPDTSAGILKLNDIGRITLKTTTPLMFDAYERNRFTGGFILVDEVTHATVGAGMICEPAKPPPTPQFEGYAI
jgi:bifunctional enzyme CysN/CysC